MHLFQFIFPWFTVELCSSCGSQWMQYISKASFCCSLVSISIDFTVHSLGQISFESIGARPKVGSCNGTTETGRIAAFCTWFITFTRGWHKLILNKQSFSCRTVYKDWKFSRTLWHKHEMRTCLRTSIQLALKDLYMVCAKRNRKYVFEESCNFSGVYRMKLLILRMSGGILSCMKLM